MKNLSFALKTTALAGLFGAGLFVATATPALAYRSYTQCDNDGDRCWRVVCDNDGDDCRREQINYYDYNRRYDWNRDRYYRGYERNYRHWVCDEDGDRCHWSYDRW
jgi:hypothetical protein